MTVSTAPRTGRAGRRHRPQAAPLAVRPPATAAIDPILHRLHVDCLQAVARCQAAFDAAPGVLAVRGDRRGGTIDRATRAARERNVDAAISALAEAESSRRLLGRPNAGSLTHPTAGAERSAKVAMLAYFRSRPAPDAGGDAERVVLEVRTPALTAAGRAALATLGREAAVRTLGEG